MIIKSAVEPKAIWSWVAILGHHWEKAQGRMLKDEICNRHRIESIPSSRSPEGKNPKDGSAKNFQTGFGEGLQSEQSNR